MRLLNDIYEIENEFGYGLLKEGDEEEDLKGIVFLDTISIKEDFQNKGHGGTLLEELLDCALDCFEYKKVIVHARPLQEDGKQNDLIRFYENHGFKKSDEYVSFQGIYMEIEL